MGGDYSGDPVSLIQQIARGDREAFGHFYDHYAPLVFAFAVRLLRVRADAEDLLQEVFLQAWRQAARYSRDRGSPEAWILTITRSRAIDRLRSMRRRDRGFVPVEELSRTQGGRIEESEVMESEARLTAHAALAGLPETQRKVLELAYFEGLTQLEIAANLGQPLGTVKTRLRDGLRRLRELLGARAAGSSS
jgi:RNA polymerase sigma-70 factor (ECF subfamily)